MIITSELKCLAQKMNGDETSNDEIYMKLWGSII